MTLFNEYLKKISLIEVLFIIVFSYLLLFILNFFQLMDVDNTLIKLIIILFFAFKLKDFTCEFKSDVSNVFSVISFREMLMIVLLNIFFSYGMLYLSNDVLHLIPSDSFLSLFIPKSIDGNMAGIISLLSVVLLSPVAEELLFRGVFLNKLGMFVPMIYAILISSLLFASLHSFGSMISAFVFGICMAIMYLKTGNILVPILAHFINNLISEAIYYLDYSNLMFTNGIVMALVSGLAVVSFIVLFKYMKVNLKNIY